MRHSVALLVVLASAIAACGDGTPGRGGATITGGAVVPSAELDHLSLSFGQLVYLPIYSQVKYMEGRDAFAFAANVSIRNTDRQHPIAITSARYYDNDGKQLREYFEDARVLDPLGTTTILVKQSDMEGGYGANFLIEWRSKDAVSEPIIEAVMVGQREVRTAAFRSPGRVVEELAGDAR